MNIIKYLVYSGEGSDKLLAWFDEEVEAIAFAKENVGEQTRVEKAECDLAEDGFLNEIIDSKTIWSYLDNNVNEFDQEFPEEEPDEFDTDFPESDINDFNIPDDEDFGDFAWEDDNKLLQGLSMKEAVDALEENESEVECKCCFELFPKEDCIKTEKGYLCKKCNQEIHSHQGTNLDLIDADPFDLDYDDPRLPEEEEEPEVKEEPVDANEVRKFEAGIEEKLEEHINDRPADIESDQELQGVDNAVVDCKKYTLVAHSEDEKPVDCKLEKPALEKPLAGEKVDAKLYESIKDDADAHRPCWSIEFIGAEQGKFFDNEEEARAAFKALRIPEDIPENTGDIVLWYLNPDKNNYDADIMLDYIRNPLNKSEEELEALGIFEGLNEAKKDDELPVDPEAAKLEVHTMLNDLVADEIEAINGYEEAKKEILDTPIAHKDNILDTIDHVEDEEKEHVDELIAATTEIPFDKEEAPAPVVEEPAQESEQEPIIEEPVIEEPVVEESLTEGKKKYLTAIEAGYQYKDEDGNIYTMYGDEVEEDDTGISYVWNTAEDDDSEFGLEKIYINEALLERSMADTPFDSDVKVGDSILIVNMEGEPDYCGRKGKVDHIDSLGQLHGTWGGLAVIPGVDKFDIITENLKEDLYNAELTVHDTWRVDNIEAKDEDEAADIAQEMIDNGEESSYDEWDEGIQVTKIETESLDEASSAEKRAFRNGGQDVQDLVQGKAIARIKDPKARDAAIAAIKAGRPEVAQQFIGDRKDGQAEIAFDKKMTTMQKAGYDKDESLEEALDPEKLETLAKEKGLKYEGEFDNDYDYISYFIEYKNGKYELSMSIYHASEDNNAENTDAHTEEIEEVFDTVKDLNDEYPDVVEDLYKEFKLSECLHEDIDDDAEIEAIIKSW